MLTSLLDGCLPHNVVAWLIETGVTALLLISDIPFTLPFGKTCLNLCYELSTVLDAVRINKIPSPVPGSLSSNGGM